MDMLNSFVDKTPVSAEEKTRLQHYAIFLTAGIPTMVVYGLVNMLRGNYLLCALILLSGGGVCRSFGLAHSKRWPHCLPY